MNCAPCVGSVRTLAGTTLGAVDDPHSSCVYSVMYPEVAY